MKIFKISILFILISAHAFSQAQNEDYDWSKAKFDTVVEQYAKENVVVLFEKDITEYYFNKEGEFKQLEITHKKVQVNTTDAISDYNTIILPSSSSVKDVITQKTRVITKDGKVKVLDNSAIKIKKDEETGRTYKYFAIEGVEIGSQIEWFYVVKRNPYYTGSLWIYQNKEPKQSVEFTLISPEHLIFKFKTLNGAPTPDTDTNLVASTKYYFVDSLVNRVDNEMFANYRANLKQIMFKLDENTERGKKNIINYGTISQNVYENTYGEVTKNETKAISKIIKAAGIESTDSEEDKIFKLEHYLKKNIAIYSTDVYDVATTFSKKYTSESGMVRTMANCFKDLGITHEIVLTSDRETAKFDEDFESYYFLDHYLIYFPSIDKYLDPTEQYYRVGLIPYEYTYNKGLFIKEVKVADYATGAGKVKFIETPSKDETYNKMFVNVKFEEDLSSILIDYTNETFGYYSNNAQPYFELLNDEQKKELQEQLIKYLSSDVEILSMNYENDASEFIGKKPLIAKAQMKSNGFTEKAGNKILFKVGDLIGPQAEMYSENERILDVENDFNRAYFRIITFDIPEGYTIQNLDDINIDVSIIEDDGTISSSFKSSYTIEGNKVTITVDEYYNRIHYPIEMYEPFRKVVNAAADFNKVVFVLSKK